MTLPVKNCWMFLCLAVLVYNAQSARVKAKDFDQQEKSSAVVSGSVSACPCWNPLASLKAEDCCYRTDAGSLSGQAAQCAAHSTINGTKQTPEDDCSAYCYVSCFKVPHKDDKEEMIAYLGSKFAEVQDMGPADLLLARASWQAQALSSGQQDASIDVKGIHALHPVGGWREDTWKKTLDRKAGVLAATEQIRAAGGTLTKEDTKSTEALRPMRSVTNFLAVPFAFNGITHVLMEGNGRLKGMQLAAEEDKTNLRNLKVQVDLLSFPNSKALVTVQEGILELWNQYVEEAFLLKRDNETQLKMFREYAGFGIAVVKCMGAYEGWISPRSACKVVNSAGHVIRTLPIGTPIGVRGKRLMPSGGTRYKLYPGPSGVAGTLSIGEDEYLLEGRDSGDQVAWEYCRKSIRPY